MHRCFSFDTELSRNPIRHVVLPQLVRDFNPNLIDTLGRTVEILETEDAFIVLSRSNG